MIKLSQNENPFGPSPLALKAIEEHYHSIHRYPEVVHNDLKSRLAKKYNVLPENIFVSGGSVGMIDLVIRSFVGPDENIVTGEITFVAYFLFSKINGRVDKRAKLVDHTIHIDNILSLCDDNTRVLFIANPNNPTGTMITHDSLNELLQTLPQNIFVVIDEAYAEYVTDVGYPDSFELQKTYSNLIIFRTFSKIYGLAGLRIGYAIARPDIIQTFEQNKMPFSVNRLAAVAALASLDDAEYVTECASINEKERIFLYKELKSMGFNVTPSQGNFIFVEFSRPDEKKKLFHFLKNESVLVRDLEPFGTKTGLRISVGRPEENQYLINSLKKFKMS